MHKKDSIEKHQFKPTRQLHKEILSGETLQLRDSNDMVWPMPPITQRRTHLISDIWLYKTLAVLGRSN